MPRKAKIGNLLAVVRAAVETGEYRDTTHSLVRQSGRAITGPEMEYVLKTGYHESSKDTFEEAYDEWNYAIRGRTLDKRDLRIVVSFDMDGMLIITAIDLDI
jgi:hypothetical protein